MFLFSAVDWSSCDEGEADGEDGEKGQRCVCVCVCVYMYVCACLGEFRIVSFMIAS